MQKRRKMNIINITAFPSAGKEANNELINFFILGNLFIDLRGLRTLKVRSAFRFEPVMPGM
jgi:hypothetical protein